MLAILAAYVAPIVLSVAMAVLVYLLYHPVPKKPDEDIVKNAETMAEKANRARVLSLRAKNNLSVTCEVLYLVLVAALFTAVILLNIDKTNVIEQICSILPFDNMFVLTFVVFVLFVCYSVLNGVFVQITKWLFYCNVPHSLLADTQRFRLFAGEEAGELTEEEWNAKHLEAAGEMRIKAIEMEKNGEHARAKQLFLEAALSGDPIAMDHYARHCIIIRHNQEAIYWLQCCVNTGKADDVTIKRLKDMKRGRHVTVKYY